MRDIVKGVVNGIVDIGFSVQKKHKLRIGSNLRTDANDYSKESTKDKHLRSFRVYVPAAL